MRKYFANQWRLFTKPPPDEYALFCAERRARPRKRCLNEAAHKL